MITILKKHIRITLSISRFMKDMSFNIAEKPGMLYNTERLN